MVLGRTLKCVLTGAVCALALAGAAAAQTRDFTIPGGNLKAALDAYARQAGVQLIYRTEDVRSVRSPGVHGAMSAQEALNRILAGTAFQAKQDQSGAFAIVRTPPKPPAATSSAESATQLAEVVVTAQKRSERLLSTPAPVTALLASTLQRQEATRLSDYAAKVPGMNYFSDQAGELQVIMRGVTTGSISSSTTGVYIDGASFSPSTNYQMGGLTAPDLDPGSLQRIEVLRGPQGTLYGASSLGGLIEYVSVAPSLTHYSGRAEVDASVVDGGGAGFGVRGLVDGPIVQDKLGFTLSGYVRHDPGFIDDPIMGLKNVNDARVDGGRAAVLWTPTADLSIELSALLHDSYSDAASDEDLNADLTPIGGGLKQYRYAPATFDIQDRLYIAHLDYTLPGAKLTSVTSYQTLKNIYDTDYTDYFGPLIGEIFSVDHAGALLDSVEHRNKLSEELRLASTGAQKLDWQAGFYFTHENSTNPQVLSAFDTSTNQPLDLGDLAHFLIISHYTEYAGFGDVTYHLTPQLSLLAGLRYGYNRQTFREPTSGLFAGGTNLAVGQSSDSSVTWLVAPQFAISPDQLLYARAASGYRPGGPNDVNPAQIAAGAPQTFKPDTLTDYELGYKAALLDRRVTVDLSVFDIEWKDIQMINVINGLGFTGNGQSARSRGVEAAATWTPRQGLTFTANAAYTDAYLTANAPTVGGKSGDRLPYVPKFAANLGADYDFPISGEVSGFVGADFHYQGDRTSAFVVGAPAGFKPPVMGSYETVDLRAGVTRGGVEVEAYVKNLNNSGGLNTINSLEIDGVSAPLAAAVIQPRTFGMSVTSKF